MKRPFWPLHTPFVQPHRFWWLQLHSCWHPLWSWHWWMRPRSWDRCLVGRFLVGQLSWPWPQREGLGSMWRWTNLQGAALCMRRSESLNISWPVQSGRRFGISSPTGAPLTAWLEWSRVQCMPDQGSVPDGCRTARTFCLELVDDDGNQVLVWAAAAGDFL